MHIGHVRFGWFNHGHRAITEGAIGLLPESSWKQFLTQNLDSIHVANDMQDYVFTGPQHGFQLEHPEKAMPRLPEPDRTIETVQAMFSPKRFKRLRDQWKKAPLLPDTIYNAPSLFQAIPEAARWVSASLDQLKNGLSMPVGTETIPLNPKQKDTFFHHLNWSLGRLTHLGADAFMPIHLSRYHDWPLGGASVHRMHRFLEGQVYKGAADYPTTPKADLETVTKTTFREVLLRNLQASYLRIFDIVAIQKKALSELHVSSTPPVYESQLLPPYRVIMDEQVHKARYALASILQSVWKDAESPDMTPFLASPAPSVTPASEPVLPHP